MNRRSFLGAFSGIWMTWWVWRGRPPKKPKATPKPPPKAKPAPKREFEWPCDECPVNSSRLDAAAQMGTFFFPDYISCIRADCRCLAVICGCHDTQPCINDKTKGIRT